MRIQTRAFSDKSPSLALILWLVCFFLAMDYTTPAYGQAEPGTQFQGAPLQSALSRSCQQAEEGSPCASSPQVVPLPHLYWHLLVYQNHLDQLAEKMEKQGKDGEPIRRSIQNQLGFSEEEFAPVRESAERLKASLDDINSRIMAVVMEEHQRDVGSAPSGQNRSASASALRALGQEREAAIAAEVAKLNDELGPTNAERLKAFITEHFAANVTVKRLSPQSSTDSPQAVSPSEVQP